MSELVDELGPPVRLAARSARSAEIILAALELLEREGREALTMRRLGEDVGMRAPSLYKHFANKQSVEAALIDIALESIGERLHAAVTNPGPEGPVVELLRAYRKASLEQPHLYRLATGQDLPRDQLSPGLEEWSGEPFFLATGEPHLAQALWAFAHGMAILEIEGRFMDHSDLDRTWAEGAAAFAGCKSVEPPE